MYEVKISRNGRLVYETKTKTMLGACKVVEEFEERGCGYEAEVIRVENGQAEQGD